MRHYIDHVLALLPFEPAAHVRLGGPPCTYVGHPLIQNLPALRPGSDAEHARRDARPPVVLVLPGSRGGEIRRLLRPFERALEIVRVGCGEMELILPTVPHLEAELRAAVRQWRVPPKVVVDPVDKQGAFRNARAALAASGTVTLELALAGIPTVAAYKVAPIEAALLRRMVNVPSAILANLVLGDNVVPEFLQEDCTPERLAAALEAVLRDGPERQRQIAGFKKLDDLMQVGASPSDKAAEIVLDLIASRRQLR
jgi:lipid-A-disaccharide synthase